MKPRPAEPVVLSAFGRIISIHELSHFLEICCCTAAHVEFEYQDVCFDDGYYAWFEGSDSLEDMNLCVTGVGYKYNIYIYIQYMMIHLLQLVTLTWHFQDSKCQASHQARHGADVGNRRQDKNNQKHMLSGATWYHWYLI